MDLIDHVMKHPSRDAMYSSYVLYVGKVVRWPSICNLELPPVSFFDRYFEKKIHT